MRIVQARRRRRRRRARPERRAAREEISHGNWRSRRPVSRRTTSWSRSTASTRRVPRVLGARQHERPVDYREGDGRARRASCPGSTTYANITLKWGITDDADAVGVAQDRRWTGRVERKNGSIVLLDDDGRGEAALELRRGWPTKWTGPTFNATATRSRSRRSRSRTKGSSKAVTRADRVPVHPAARLRRRRRRSCTARASMRLATRARRDRAAQGPARAAQSRLPRGHPAVAGDHAARRRSRTINPKVIEGLFAGRPRLPRGSLPPHQRERPQPARRGVPALRRRASRWR